MPKYTIKTISVGRKSIGSINIVLLQSEGHFNAPYLENIFVPNERLACYHSAVKLYIDCPPQRLLIAKT